MSTKIAIYPGTFDPITNGHVDIVERAAQLFDRVIVAVAASSRKNPLFTLENRIIICREVFSQYKKIEVISFDHMRIVDLAKKYNANYLVKGLRNTLDFDYEAQMAAMNRTMSPEIETIFLISKPINAFISSTMVREIISLKGDVSAFVPKVILKYL